MRTKQFLLGCGFAAVIVTGLLPGMSDPARADLCVCIGGGMMRCSLLGHTSVEPATDAFPQCKLRTGGGGERKQPPRAQRKQPQVFSCPRGYKSIDESSYGTHRCVPINEPSPAGLAETNDEALARKNWFSRADRPTRTPDEQHRGSSLIGSVGALRGEAYWVWPDGKRTPARAGEPAFFGNRIVTAPTGRVQLLLLDNTVFTVGPKSDMEIDDFVYDPNVDLKKLSVKFTKGIFRLVTGKLARNDPADMKVTMPAGYTGIRGSEVQFDFDQDGGNIEVYSGEATFTNTIGEKFVLKAAQTIAFDRLGRYVNLPVLPPYDKQLQEWCYGNDATPEMQFASCDNVIRSEKLSGRNLAITFARRAGAYNRKNDYDRAIADLTEAIRIDPSYAQSYGVRGWSYYFKGDNDRAIADLNEAIRLNPKYAPAYDYRGRARLDKHDYDRAIADLSEAIRLDPSDFGPFALRGRAWFESDDNDRAISDYDEAIRLAPTSASVYADRGQARQNKGDADGAIADYNEAIRLDPNNSLAHTNRGQARHRKGDDDGAVTDYNEAIRLDPKNAYAYFGRGRFNLFTGALPKALADINQASELGPKDAYIALWLDIANKRNNLPGRLAGTTAQLDMTNWPAPIIRLYLDQLTYEGVLAAADNPNAVTKKHQVCEANFYSGELALQKGNKDKAVNLFKLAIAECPKAFYEYEGADAELKALGQRM